MRHIPKTVFTVEYTRFGMMVFEDILDQGAELDQAGAAVERPAREPDQVLLDQACAREHELAGAAVERPARELDQVLLDRSCGRVYELAGTAVERPARELDQGHHAS